MPCLVTAILRALRGAATSSRGDDSLRRSPPRGYGGWNLRAAKPASPRLAGRWLARSSSAMLLTVLLPDDVRLGPAWVLPLDRGRAARRSGRRRPAARSRAVARLRMLSIALVSVLVIGRVVVDGAADRRPHPRRPADELGQRSARGWHRSCGCRTDRVRIALLGARRRRRGCSAPYEPRPHPDLAFPQQLNPAVGPPRLAPAVRRLPLPQLHQLNRVQPDRRDAARAVGEARDGGAGGDLARDPRARDRPGREHFLVAGPRFGYGGPDG